MQFKVAIQLLKRLKARFNAFLDRLIDFFNWILMDYYELPDKLKIPVKNAVRWLGHVCLWIQDFPRTDGYRLTGGIWKIIYVGSQQGLKEIAHLFFPESPVIENLGRVSWRTSSSLTQTWLEQEADLVVWEHSPLLPGFNPKSTGYVFRNPIWIQQILSLPSRLETLTAGKRIRGYINRGNRFHYLSSFTRDRAKLDQFYDRMYIPTVQTRHKERALITAKKDMLHWFKRGGLVLVHEEVRGELAGMVCYLTKKEGYLIEGGILKSDPSLWQEGINDFLWWSTMQWAQANQKNLLDVGGSHAWVSSGSFLAKTNWGARVLPRKRIYRCWSFMAHHLSDEQRLAINHIGFINKVNEGYYRVFLSNGTPPNHSEELVRCRKFGLKGLMMISPSNSGIIPAE